MQYLLLFLLFSILSKYFQQEINCCPSNDAISEIRVKEEPIDTAEEDSVNYHINIKLEKMDVGENTENDRIEKISGLDKNPV